MNKLPTKPFPSVGEAVLIRVFVNARQGGNPVPLVANAQGMSKQAMQDVAKHYGFESAFVLPPSSPDANWRFRFFVPEHEMEMCEHATVGTLWALRQWGLWQTDTAIIETLSGNVAAYWDAYTQSVWISQPAVSTSTLSSDRRLSVTEVLGISANIPGLHMINASTSRVKTLIRLPDVETLNALTPDFTQMRELCESIDSTGLYPYAMPAKQTSTSLTVHARQFPKASGYPEDAATGIAAAALWGWLLHSEVITDASAICTIMQGEAMGSPSIIQVRGRIAANGELDGCWLSGAVMW